MRSRFTPSVLLGLFHAYIGWRVLPDLPVAPWVRWLGVAVLLVSLVSIPLGFMSRSVRDRPWLARFSVLGLFMMGFTSTLVVFTLLRDIGLAVSVPFLSDAHVRALLP